MRLTLRTMLAYLDEQLDPPQMTEIGLKIRESGVASGMIDRIRTSMKKGRMEAPKLDARGIGKDANSVAEYLDNVLDKEEIAELEQLCLNSDVHLAEVAACHQMLSVLPKVEFSIDADLRNRLYDIPSRLRDRAIEKPVDEDADFARPKQVEVKAPSSNGAKKKKRKKSPAVPEYFKHSEPASGRWLPLALTAALVLLAAAFGAYVTREQWTNSFAWNATKAKPAEKTPSATKNDQAAPDQAENPASTKDKETVEEAKKSEEPTDKEVSQEKDIPAATENDGDARPADIDENGFKKEVTIPPEGVASDGPPLPPLPGEIEKTSPETSGKSEGNPAPSGAPQTPVIVGDLPLVTWDSTLKGWNRVLKGQPLPWDGVVALVGSRSTCQSASGLQTTIVGPSEVRFEKLAASRDAVWVIDNGRLVIDAKDAGGMTASWNLAGRAVHTKFVSPDCQAAIEVVREVPNGVDPANPDESPAKVFISVLRGNIALQAGGEDQLIDAGTVLDIDPSGVIKTLPKNVGAPLWVDELTASESAKQVSKELAKRLVSDKEPLSIALQELASDNRINVAALGAQALAQLGQVKPLCDQFRDTQYKLYWRTNHAYLKELIQSSPPAAEMVRQQLEEHYPAESEAVYRTLIGYTKDQFVDEGRQLIGGLESESLMQRVLAYQTLVDLVGPRGGKYQPDDPPLVRSKAVASWLEAFNSGKMKLKD